MIMRGHKGGREGGRKGGRERERGNEYTTLVLNTRHLSDPDGFPLDLVLVVDNKFSWDRENRERSSQEYHCREQRASSSGIPLHTYVCPCLKESKIMFIKHDEYNKNNT